MQHAIGVRLLHWGNNRPAMYAMAAITPAFAVMAQRGLAQLNYEFPGALFYTLTTTIALYAGLGPGLLNAAVCALLVNYWLIAPAGEFSLSVEKLTSTLTFFAASSFSGYLSARLRTRLRQNRRQLQRERKIRLRLRRAQVYARKLIDKLNQEHDDLERSLQARDVFLAVAGHELRTPLTTLLLQLQSSQRLLRRAPNTSSSQEILQRRLDSAAAMAKSLSALTDQVLQVSRLTGGVLPLEREPVDLAQLTRESVERFAEAAQSASCELQLNSVDSLVGMWDRMRLEQIISNLLGNAIKYGRGAPVTVSLRPDATLQNAILSVADHGIGIDAESQKRIFERFERAVAARRFAGLGLGLWIVRQISNALGGDIAVESKPGVGSAFTVTLPRDTSKPLALTH